MARAVTRGASRDPWREPCPVARASSLGAPTRSGDPLRGPAPAGRREAPARDVKTWKGLRADETEMTAPRAGKEKNRR
ncbi:hypothetical protein GCM10010149_48130 [Nonomuraea roseoviolacea subsp. roseoviolacea]